MKTTRRSMHHPGADWQCRWLLIIALCVPAVVQGAELNGKVAEVSGSSITITMDSELVPNASDRVEFFFKPPGFDEEIVVGTGVVTNVNGKAVSAKFESGSGTPQPGNLVRIISANPRPPAMPAAAPPAAPPPSAHDDVPLTPGTPTAPTAQESPLPPATPPAAAQRSPHAAQTPAAQEQVKPAGEGAAAKSSHAPAEPVRSEALEGMQGEAARILRQKRNR